jgi:hypothetical protein
MEITLTEMNPNDEIRLRTQFSDYSFRIIDPLECRGVLCGGRLREKYEAVFVEIVRPTKSTKMTTGQLAPGDRAVFIVGSNPRQRLTTSPITAIVVSEMGSRTADEFDNVQFINPKREKTADRLS